YFYYDGDRIIAEREGSSWVVRYLLGLKPCGHVVSGQVRVYHADRLGSVRWVTDGSGNLVASYVYEGFGKIVGQDGNEVVPYRFCGLWGYRNDGDAGLLHVGARYYEVETGRWVQKDPMLVGINLYVYCANTPALFVDPSGNIWVLLLGAAGAAVAGAIVGIVGYIGYQLGDNEPPTLGGICGAAVAGAVGGVLVFCFAPEAITVAAVAEGCSIAFIAGLSGGLVEEMIENYEPPTTPPIPPAPEPLPYSFSPIYKNGTVIYQ
ncbi:MAG: RHS repeat-associated core domain-containing protein, partial [Armatimonadota bacterium]|nr:RHS repeat-associated core domain-containing protein [Armatimonadota bacterium]